MKITNSESKTSIVEIGDGIYRISTPVPPMPALPAGFTFNQFLITDDEPLLFHTGPRRMFPLVREAIEAVIPASSLRYLGISHFEAAECGALNEFLEVAPRAVPLCGAVAKMVSVDDVADREAIDLGDGEQLSLGEHTWGGSIPPTCPTDGIAVTCSSRRRPPFSVAISSLNQVPITHPSSRAISWDRAKPCGM